MPKQLLNKNFSVAYDIDVLPLGRDCVFIHGNLASRFWWGPVVERLRESPQEFASAQRALLYDWRGCGESQPGWDDEPVNLATLRQDLVEMVRRLELQRPTLIGHSTGGLIALAAAVLEPDLFHSLVLVDTVPPWPTVIPDALAQAMMKMKTDRSFAQTVMLGALHQSFPSQAFLDRIVDDAMQVEEPIWNGVRQMIGEVDLRYALADLDLPTLLLHGEEDGIVPLTGTEQLAQLLPKSILRPLKNMGHSPNVENPELFVEHLMGFWKTLDS